LDHRKYLKNISVDTERSELKQKDKALSNKLPNKLKYV